MNVIWLQELPLLASLTVWKSNSDRNSVVDKLIRILHLPLLHIHRCQNHTYNNDEYQNLLLEIKSNKFQNTEIMDLE